MTKIGSKNFTNGKNIAKKIIVHSGKISAVILKVLLIAGATTIDQMFSPSLYKIRPINYKELWNEPFWDWDNKPEIFKQKIKPRSISAALQRLQKQGLVMRENKQWTLTKIGKNFMESSFQYKKFRNKRKLSPKDNVKRIVIFDVPEKEKEKRNWLRGELIYHEYEPLQKSVWIGYRSLLPEFIKTIDFLNMNSYVHIFSIKDEGTIFS
jgi:hypothetical protein